MKLISSPDVRPGPIYASIISDTTPSPLPTTGENVDGMEKDQTFSPGSVIFVVDPNASHRYYVANESGEFVGQ